MGSRSFIENSLLKVRNMERSNVEEDVVRTISST